MPKLGGLLQGLLEGGLGEVTERQKRKRAMAESIQLAQEEARIKASFPSAEEEGKRRVLTLLRQLVQPRYGVGRIGPPTAQAEQVASQQQQELEALTQLFFPRTTSQQTFILGAGGVATPVISPTGEPLHGGKVLTPPLSIEQREEEARRLTVARARGTQQVKYEDLITQFNFISQDVDSVFGFFEKVPAGRARGPSAQVGAVFGLKGSENVLQYTRTKDLILSKIAKTFGGEVGVLTDRDIQRISRGFPALWMNARERDAAIQWVKDYIRRRIDEYTQASQGSPTGLEGMSDEELRAIINGS